MKHRQRSTVKTVKHIFVSAVFGLSALTAFGGPGAPSITVQPSSAVVGVGQTASLSVTADGTALCYQWLKDGVILTGQTDSNLTYFSFQFTNSGSYNVVITNASGLAISYPASLSVSNVPLRGWGENFYGQLGIGTDGAGTDTNLPTQMTNNVVAMAGGGEHSLFVKADGTLWAMGRNNNYGQLGIGTMANTNLPVQVTNGVVAVAAGYGHSLFVKTNGTLWAMGYNGSGALGNGTYTSPQTLPIQVTNNVIAVAGGQEHSLFVKTDGTLWAMGKNTEGQLGIGTTANTNLPTQVTNNVVAVAVGGNHSLFMKTDGTLWAMGQNTEGQLGNGTYTSPKTLPIQVTNNVVAVAAGIMHSLFLKTDGTLWAMGLNNCGQLGIGSTVNTNLPIQVTNGVVAMAGGNQHSLFVKADGTLWAMGRNDSGQLGDGTLTQSTVPVLVNNGGLMTASLAKEPIAYHSLAITEVLWPGMVILGTNGTTIASGAAASVANGTDFGTFTLGAAAVTNTFSVTNGGTLALTISGWTTNGTGANAFAIAGIPATVSPGTVSNFTIAFNPSIVGTHTAAVSIVNDSATPSYVVNLCGVVESAPTPNGWLAIQVTPASGTWQLTAPVGYTGQTAGTGNLAAVSAVTGVYGITYGALVGYVAPSNQSQFVTGNSTTIFAGVYTATPVANGWLAINVTPNGGTWQLTAPAGYAGPTAGTGNLAAVSAVTGAYGIAYGALAGYVAPSNQSQFVTGGSTTLFAGVYFIVAPAGVSASDGRYMDKVALAWSAVSGVTGYQIWRHTADNSAAASQLGTSAGTTYSDASASGGQLYYYWVKATNASATSAFSSSDSGWRRSVGCTHYADVDIDGDGKADLVIFDPVTGTWRAKLSGSGYAEVSGVFGGPNCTLVPGDYDGDGQTDPGVYEELTGLWTVMLSSMGYGRASATLGGMGYTPVPGDFDGDRKTDLGVYEAVSGKWQVRLSASGYAEAGTTFGGSDYLPVQRDYDGDRKSDPAIYQLTTGDWRVMLSGSGYGIASAIGFGGTGYAPVVGDYDADGKADPAIYHESTGTWIIMLSGSGYLIAMATLGGSGYAALPGDYDGDGKTDPAVYQTTTGQWLVMLSGSGYGIATANFGGEGYDPVGFGTEQGGWQAADQVTGP